MWIISLVAVALCSYFLAKIAANLISLRFEGDETPASFQVPVKAGQSERQEGGAETFDPIVVRNVFDSRDVGALTSEEPSSGEEEANPTGEAVLTGLKIKLVSTFSVGDGTDQRSTCVIESGEAKGEPDVYTVNDKKLFAPGTRVVRIQVSRVEFVNKGRLEYVELEDFSKGVSINMPPRSEGPSVAVAQPDEPDKDVKVEQTTEGKFVIDRSEIDQALANLDKLYTDVRAVPHFKEGKPNGLKLLSVRPGSIFSKLGLRRGDVLQKINGSELDIKRGLELFNQLKSESRITIELERRDKTVTQEYEIR